MYFKQLALLALSGFLILIFVNLGPNKAWFERRIYSFPEQLDEQLQFNTTEGRKEYRWAEPYFMTKGIAAYVRSQGDSIDKVTILLPPQEYCDKNGIRFTMPEPVVCYAFAGLRTTRMNCKDVYDADYCVFSLNGTMQIQQLKTREEIDQVINIYKAVN